MSTTEERKAKIATYQWADLRTLWEAVQNKDTPGWEPGLAFEYLILRVFELDGGTIRWPYTVELFGERVEQIDGALYHMGLNCLVESKDLGENVAIGPIAKLRNQLLRRPAGTLGLMFSSREFTEPAVFLAHFALPQAILLWSGDEVNYLLVKETMGRFLQRKFRACVETGIPDYDIQTENIP